MNDNFDEKLREMAKKSNVKEPDELRNKITDTCESYEKKSFNYKKYVSVAAIFVAVVIAMGVYIPTYAKESPLVKRIVSYLIDKYDSVNYGYKENLQNQNVAVNSNGYTISIEDIYYDKTEMVIFYKIKSNKPLDTKKKYILDAEVEGEVEYFLGNETQDGEFIDKYTYGGMYQCYMEEENIEDLPEKINVILNINGLVLTSREEWDEISFEIEPIPLLLDSTKIKSEEIDIYETAYIEGASREYVKATNLSTGIDLDVIRFMDEPYNGNNIGEGLWDSKKGYLHCKGMVYDYSTGGLVNKFKYELPSEDGELMIVPYKFKDWTTESVGDILREFELQEYSKLDLGQYGSMEIEKIEFGEYETVMTIKTKGYVSLDPFEVALLYDDEKKGCYPISVTNREVYSFMEMKADYTFKPMDRDKKYYFRYCEQTELEILEDQIIKIK